MHHVLRHALQVVWLLARLHHVHALEARVRVLAGGGKRVICMQLAAQQCAMSDTDQCLLYSTVTTLTTRRQMFNELPVHATRWLAHTALQALKWCLSHWRSWRTVVPECSGAAARQNVVLLLAVAVHIFRPAVKRRQARHAVMVH